MNKITTRNPPLLTLKNRKVFFLTRNNQKLHIVNDRLLKTNTLIKNGLRLKDSASSQAPAWELKSRSSSFLSCEARASLSGFPSWSLGTSRPVVLCRETALRLTDFSLGILCFHAITCAFAGFLVFPLDFMCFHWTSCVSTGLRVFSSGNACFSQPTLLGINVGLTIEPLDQPTATCLSACRVCKQLFRLPTLSLRVKTAKAVLLQVYRILVHTDERSVWER